MSTLCDQISRNYRQKTEQELAIDHTISMQLHILVHMQPCKHDIKCRLMFNKLCVLTTTDSQESAMVSEKCETSDQL